MTHQFSVSDLGLRLIKAYEGYRSESRVLISGDNVVGYGHRIADQDAIALTRAEAEMLLRKDIQPVEELVNEAVFAPLTQGQFDALCSLAYNIGPDAFLKSDVVKAINNGRPIDAANSFDIWRKGEVDGKIFIIDALVRRRTAEKALFLKPDRRVVTSPRDSMPPKRDDTVAGFKADATPVYTRDDAEGYVDQIPYEQRPNPGRRREDGPAGVLELSEYYEGDDIPSETVPDSLRPYVSEPSGSEEAGIKEASAPVSSSDAVPDLTLSPIAEAAAEVSDRLDALIDDQAKSLVDLSDMPNSVLNVDTDERAAKVLPFRHKASKDVTLDPPTNEAVTVEVPQQRPIENPEAQNLNQNNRAERENRDVNADSAARFIERRDYVQTEPGSVWAFGVMMFSGLVMLAASLYAMVKDPVSLLGPWGPVAAMAGLIMGGVIILGSIYYILKSTFSD